MTITMNTGTIPLITFAVAILFIHEHYRAAKLWPGTESGEPLSHSRTSVQ